MNSRLVLSPLGLIPIFIFLLPLKKPLLGVWNTAFLPFFKINCIYVIFPEIIHTIVCFFLLHKMHWIAWSSCDFYENIIMFIPFFPPSFRAPHVNTYWSCSFLLSCWIAWILFVYSQVDGIDCFQCFSTKDSDSIYIYLGKLGNLACLDASLWSCGIRVVIVF